MMVRFFQIVGIVFRKLLYIALFRSLFLTFDSVGPKSIDRSLQYKILYVRNFCFACMIEAFWKTIGPSKVNISFVLSKRNYHEQRVQKNATNIVRMHLKLE